MFKREMKYNFKSFIIWLLVTLAIFLVVFLIYPSIISSDNIKMLDEVMAIFPEEIIKAFNFDLSSMDSVYGWLKTEGFVFILLIIGSFAGILGSSILLKEENDKTIEYLHSLPVKRHSIVLSKVCVSLIYIILFIVILSIFNLIGLTISGEFDFSEYLLLSICPLFSALPIYFIILFASTFFHKTKKVFGLSLGFILVSYVLNTLSTIDTSVQFLKYTSVFALSDIRNIIITNQISINIILCSMFISVVFLILTIIRYDKKDLI